MAAYDVLIIGGGPAGITAGIYAARKKVKTLVISSSLGGKAAFHERVEGYPGYKEVTGPDLAAKFEDQLKSLDVEVKDGEEAKEISGSAGNFKVTTNGGTYESKTVVIATGAKPRMLGIPGEKQLIGKGLAYCATCDAPLFAGMDVAVVGGGHSAVDAALQLSRIAKKTYVVNINPALGGNEEMRKKLLAAKSVEVINNAKSTEITGDKTVTGLRVSVAGKERLLPVGGIFVEIGWTPASDIAKAAKRNEKGEIIVGPECETSVPGMFAAGDVTSVEFKQVVIAAGEGAKAALSAVKYVSTTK